LAAALAVAVVAACTGENLFTGPSQGGTLLGPAVEITAPAEDAMLTLGDSVQVSAEISSANGVSEVIFSGAYQTGTAAYAQLVVALGGATDTTISRFLQPVGTVTGAAKIAVEASDVTGRDGADTISVTIN
jgi:hypothetical protein